jgi:hypothetical protein
MSNNHPIVNSIINRQNGFIPSSSFQSKLFKDRLSIAKSLFKRDLVSHYGCVNAIEFSAEGNWLTSGNEWIYYAEKLFVAKLHKKKRFHEIESKFRFAPMCNDVR